jgi:hypothetical protein
MRCITTFRNVNEKIVFKLGAVKSKVTVFIWCCIILNTTNGVVKKSKLFELVLLINHEVNYLVL